MTNNVVVNTFLGGGLGGRAAVSAFGEKNAMLGTVVRVILVRYEAGCIWSCKKFAHTQYDTKKDCSNKHVRLLSGREVRNEKRFDQQRRTECTLIMYTKRKHENDTEHKETEQ